MGERTLAQVQVAEDWAFLKRQARYWVSWKYTPCQSKGAKRETYAGWVAAMRNVFVAYHAGAPWMTRADEVVERWQVRADDLRKLVSAKRIEAERLRGQLAKARSEVERLQGDSDTLAALRGHLARAQSRGVVRLTPSQVLRSIEYGHALAREDGAG